MKLGRNDYISSIYRIEEAGKDATNKLISENLEVSPSSVTEMLNKLRDDGLIHPSKKISLTQKGKTYAKKIISKHRLWEYFLTAMLGYKWEEVHEQCQYLQNITSDEMFDRLNQYLQYPHHCPHGGIIYANNDHHPRYLTLDQGQIGKKYTIKTITDDKSLLTYVDKLGLAIGTEITIKHVEEFDGSVNITIRDEEKHLSPKAAREIFIQEI